MKYEVPYSNVGKGGIFKAPVSGKWYHTPSWIEVAEGTTLDDIVVKAKPFRELFSEPERKSWQYKSASSDKTYTVREGRNGLFCDCWGYIAHKKCKHIRDVKEKIYSDSSSV